MFASFLLIDSPSLTASNGPGFDSSSPANCLPNETVDENIQTIEAKPQYEPDSGSVVKSSPSFFSHALFIWFDQFVHWGHEKSLLSNCDDHAWNLDDGNR